MDDRFYTEILEQNKSAVREKVKEALLESVGNEFKWELPLALKEIVNEFIKDEIIPEVKKELFENKDQIVESCTSIVRAVPAEIGKAMQEKLAETLTSSWKLKGVTDALFN